MIRLLLAALAFCILHSAFRTLAAEPLPVDIVWQSNAIRNTYPPGPFWNEDGHAYMSFGSDHTLTILRDGELVRRARLGDIIAIDRGDVYPDIEGVEFIVALDFGTTHEVVILNGNNLWEISSFTAADEENDWERVTALKWIEGERKLLVGRSFTRVTESERTTNYVWDGRTRVYDGDSLDLVATINTGVVRKFVQLGSDILTFGAVSRCTKYYRVPEVSVEISPGIFVLDSLLELQRSIRLPQIRAFVSHYLVTPNLSVGFSPDFACIEGDESDILLLNYSYEMGPRIFKIDNSNWRLVTLDYDVDGFITSMIPIITNPASESIDYVLCPSNDGILFLNPYNLEITETEYTTPYSWGGDFDGDGKTELLGFLDGQLTCARPQPLAAKDESSFSPFSFQLFQPYPSPFNSSTTISFSLPGFGEAGLRVYDLKGRLVKELVNDRLEAGEHKVVWEAKGMGSGVYVVKLEGEGKAVSRKIVLIR